MPSDVSNKKREMSTQDMADLTLDELLNRAQQCTACGLWMERKKLVFHKGDVKSDLFLVGEAPGKEENLSGVPFCGKAGQLLSKWINDYLNRPVSSVYITNIVKCRPPNNRTPKDGEIEGCISFLKQQIRLVRPRAIVGIGAPASKTLLGDPELRITLARGEWRNLDALLNSGEDIPVMPIFHPAFLLRKKNLQNVEHVKSDLTRVKVYLDELKEKRK